MRPKKFSRSLARRNELGSESSPRQGPVLVNTGDRTVCSSSKKSLSASETLVGSRVQFVRWRIASIRARRSVTQQLGNMNPTGPYSE